MTKWDFGRAREKLIGEFFWFNQNSAWPRETTLAEQMALVTGKGRERGSRPPQRERQVRRLRLSAERKAGEVIGSATTPGREDSGRDRTETLRSPLACPESAPMSVPQKQCPQCKQWQPLSAAICPHCGRQFRTTAPHQAAPVDQTLLGVAPSHPTPTPGYPAAAEVLPPLGQPQQQHPALRCIACGTDAGQKVSAIVQAGFSSGASVGASTGVGYVWGAGAVSMVGTTTTSHQSATVLAQLLAAPHPPLRPGWAGAGCVLFGITAWAIIASSWLQDPAARVPSTLLFVGASAAFAIGGWAWFILSQIQGGKRHAEGVQRWQLAMTRWDQLFYCARCDTVYNPTTGHRVPAREMYRLL